MNVVIWTVAFTATGTYSFTLFAFLNVLYKEKILFYMDSVERDELGVAFCRDIFDVFWMIVLWLPLTLFTATFLQTAHVAYGTKTIVITVAICALSLVVCGLVINRYTTKYNQLGDDAKTWSYLLFDSENAKGDKRRKAYRAMYYGMGIYNCFLALVDLFLSCECLIDSYICNNADMTLCTYTLMSTIAFIALFIMNTFSKLTALIKLKAIKQYKLFPRWQMAGATIFIVLFALAAMRYFQVTQENQNAGNTLSFVVASILIPGIPIVIQFIQLVSPLRKE